MRVSTSFFVLSALATAGFPGCKLGAMDITTIHCSQGQTAWNCHIAATTCQSAYLVRCCADTMPNAISIADTKATNQYRLLKAPVGTMCDDTGNTSYVDSNSPPNYMPQGDPSSCDASAADDPCLACAKLSCCGTYQACSADTNCSCLVGCLFQGGTVAACTSTDNCGPASSISNTTATCLAVACPGQCENPGGMAGGMCPPMTTGSSSSSGAPSCTPGPMVSGQSCFSDGDCASCVCNMQIMTCN